MIAATPRGGTAAAMAVLLATSGGVTASTTKDSTTARPMDSIEHIVIFMQENRPYDHYFGSMQGVRGFNDRTALPLQNGLNTFYQPVTSDEGDSNSTSTPSYMLPFHVDASTTDAMCMPAPEMDYTCDLKMWHEGRHDAWNTARDPGMGMAYFNRDDLPYYYALYDSFATGDHYFQSTFTATNPNRMFLFTGSNGLSAGDENGGQAVLDNSEPHPGYTWSTMGEVLEEAGVSWRVYQQVDNFDDNAFAWFANYQSSRPGDALFDKGMARTNSVIDSFESDIQGGTLPQVSWVIAPTKYSEHATHHPSAGEDFTARLLQVLEKYPDTYATTAFILDYDEGGQFFDHAWAPTPPMSAEYGVSTAGVDGEVNSDVMTDVDAPIGMGFRVPLLIVSPWTRGNIVVSEVFDHTSVVQLVEERFNVSCPVMSPWRRAAAGNLLSAFKFEEPDYSWPDLPDTSHYVTQSIAQCRTLPSPQVPTEQSFPTQESGIRISRALPYQFSAADTSLSITDSISSDGGSAVKMVFQLSNTGTGGAPFMLLDNINLATSSPRHYTVEGGKQVIDTLSLPITDTDGTAMYHVTLVGPNGFARELTGDASSDVCVGATATLAYDVAGGAVVVDVFNAAAGSVSVLITDNAYNTGDPYTATLPTGESYSHSISTASSGNWYDITVAISGTASSDPTTATTAITTTTTAACMTRRYMGRMETGVDTISDPAMAAGLPGLLGDNAPLEHPKVPEKHRIVRRNFLHTAAGKDSVFYDDVLDEL